MDGPHRVQPSCLCYFATSLRPLLPRTRRVISQRHMRGPKTTRSGIRFSGAHDRPAGRITRSLVQGIPMRLPLSLLAACCAAGSLAAQSNAERMANDHYTRSHDYDLIHQKIEVSHFDWDSTSFDGRGTTTLLARRATLDSVILDAGAKLVLQRVTGT